MKIHKSKSGFYIRPYILKNGVKKQTTLNFKTKEEAMEKILELKKGISLSSKTSKGDYTFDYVWSDFMGEMERKLKPTTYYSYRVNAEKHILKFFKGMQINSISRVEINKFLTYLKRLDVGQRHKNKLLNILKTFCKFSVINYETNHEWVTNIPSFREDQIEQKRQQSKYYKLEDFKKFINGTSDLVEITLFNVLMFSGLRIGELRALMWSDFNKKNNSLSISKTLSSKTFNNQSLFSPKSISSNRIVFIPGSVSKMLAKLKETTKQNDNDYIFSGKTSISETTIHRMNTRIAKVAGIHKIKIHEFRHSYATLMVKNGMKATVLQKQLGHSDIKVTLKYYVHFELEDQSNEVQSIFNDL